MMRVPTAAAAAAVAYFGNTTAGSCRQQGNLAKGEGGSGGGGSDGVTITQTPDRAAEDISSNIFWQFAASLPLQVISCCCCY